MCSSSHEKKTKEFSSVENTKFCVPTCSLETEERRKFKCPFKITTHLDDSGNVNATYAYKTQFHNCNQDILFPIIQKFKNKLKERMAGDYKAKFEKIFNEEKNCLIQTYKDNEELLERKLYTLKDNRIYQDAANKARPRRFPKNPTSYSDIDLEKIGLDHILLGKCGPFDDSPQEITELVRESEKNKDVILFGTRSTADAWSRSEFKSGDGTFKICPRLFYQVICPLLKNFSQCNFFFRSLCLLVFLEDSICLA